MRAVGLSVVIPGRNEEFMRRTCESVLDTMRGDTEVIAVLDGYEHDMPEHPRLIVLKNQASVGQRAATNQGVRESRAQYVMKLDAHCAMAPGFDVQLLKDMRGHDDEWTLIPQQHNLHAFDWACRGCGKATYQGYCPAKCEACAGASFEKRMVWEPKKHATYTWFFDNTLHFQYWDGRRHTNPYHKRREVRKQEIVDTMGCLGACWLMNRDRYWHLGGMDEAHGSWGQMGTELGCKAWLSGGAMVCTRRTWFAHMFRTANFAAPGGSSWPYPITQHEIDKAREYSRDLWMNDKWTLAVRPLSWLVERFRPVPTWHS